MSECNSDAECPGSLWCYKYFGNSTPTFCECPSFYGRLGKDTGCDGFSFHAYLWIVPTVLNALYISCVLLYSIYSSRPFRAINHWTKERQGEGKVKVPATIKIWLAGFVGLLCMLLSFAIRLWDIFTPDGWARIEIARRLPGAEPELLKSSALLSPYFVVFMAYILFVVIVVIECGILWIELAYNAKKLSSDGRFRKLRAASYLLEALIIVATIVSVATGSIGSFSLFLYIGVPGLLSVFVMVFYGRYQVLRMLEKNFGKDQDGRRASSATQPSKIVAFEKELRVVSSTLLILLLLAVVPFIVIYFAIVTDFRTIRPGELGYFVFALQMFDYLVAIGSTVVFIHMNGALRALGSSRSRRASKEYSGPDPGRRARRRLEEEKTFEFDSNKESPSFNKWKKKLDDVSTYQFDSAIESPSFNQWKGKLAPGEESGSQQGEA